MWRAQVPWLLLGLGVLGACGGRFERNAPVSDAIGEAGSPSTRGQAGSPALDDACTRQFREYRDYRTQVIAEFSAFACAVDSDCLSFYDQASCDPSCVLITTGARRGVVDRLNNFETSNCDPTCSPEPWLSCPTPVPARCVAGVCQQQ